MRRTSLSSLSGMGWDLISSELSEGPRGPTRAKPVAPSIVSCNGWAQHFIFCLPLAPVLII